jgi:hypothetical protein
LGADRGCAAGDALIARLSVPSSTGREPVGGKRSDLLRFFTVLRRHARFYDGTLEKAAGMANHASTRTTQLYDRRRDEVSLDEVERIAI